MAKLKDVRFSKEGKSGDKIDFTSSVTVDSSGRFFASIPDMLVSFCRKADRDNDTQTIRKAQRYRVSGDTLDDVIHTIGDSIGEYLSVETTEEIVIAYHYTASCHYVTDPEGEIHANGGGIGGYEWHGPSRSINLSAKSDWAVGFRARVVRLVTHTRNESVRREIKRIGNNGIREIGEAAEDLNSFAHVVLPDRPKTIPYTPEAARMLYRSMLALCHVAHGLESFFSDESKVIEAAGKNQLIWERGGEQQ